MTVSASRLPVWLQEVIKPAYCAHPQAPPPTIPGVALTHQDILRDEILTTLAAFANTRGTRREVLDAMNRRLAPRWSVEDLASPAKHPYETNWRNRASYERMNMVRDGLISNAERGVWALTDAGRLAVRGGTGPPLINSVSWDLEPGDNLNRADRSELYGGATYGGIQPSSTSPNVFVYSDPAAGERNGYTFDGWSPDDDVFLYTGEGRIADQRMWKGNRAVADHVIDGKALRLFVADGKETGSDTMRQVYLGEFEVDQDLPYVRAEAPDADGALRSVVVFRLRPVGAVLRREADRSGAQDVPPSASTGTASNAEVQQLAWSADLERNEAQEFAIAASTASLGRRRESQLTERFHSHMSIQGAELKRFRIRPPATVSPLFTDLFDTTNNVLYEAKASSTREAVRMAIGQLLDYQRFLPPYCKLCILLPAPPAPDLLPLLSGLGIGLVVESTPGQFSWELEASDYDGDPDSD